MLSYVKKCESPFKTNNLVTKWLCSTRHNRGKALIIFYDGKRNSSSDYRMLVVMRRAGLR